MGGPGMGGPGMGGPGMGGPGMGMEGGMGAPTNDKEKKPNDEKAKPDPRKPLTRGTRAISSYAGCHNDVEAPIDANNTGVFILNKQVRPASVTDGLAHTIFIGEKISDDTDLGWMAGSRATLRNTGTGINGTEPMGMGGPGMGMGGGMGGPGMGGGGEVAMPIGPNGQPNNLYVGGFGSEHPGVANFLFGDGSVQAVSEGIALQVLQQYGHRCDGKLIKEGPSRE